MEVMNFIVTAGPTYESLDDVRRLTNFSTGKLGTELANYLAAQGHDVTLLRGYYSIYQGEHRSRQVQTFTTTADLRERLRVLSSQHVHAIFHASAVSDFTFGKVWERLPDGKLTECKSGKLSTRQGILLAELVPTPKIISDLREWYPHSKIVGWKYEVEGDRDGVIARGEQQMLDNRTDACAVNGKAYGFGFGLVTGPGRCTHFSNPELLYAALEKLAKG